MTSESLEIKTCRITLPLPAETKVLVETGDLVSEGALLAQTQNCFQEFNLTEILKVSPQKVDSFLLVSPGDKVKEGEILARKKSLLSDFVFRSPVQGVFTELLPEGFLKIKVSEAKEIKSPIKAKVVALKNGESVTLEFDTTVISGDWGEGPEKWGEVEILGKQSDITLADLPEAPKGKILVARDAVSPGFVHKAEALEAAGIVASDCHTRVKTTDLALLIVTDKEGAMPVQVWETLKKHVGKQVSVSGKEKTLKIPLS